jgi:peptidoglycan/LPS O-acetylase OafA/YrhL
LAPDLGLDQRGSTALDQWRGFALALVLVSHGFYFTGRVSGLGRVGVNLFFFISGILVFRTLSRSRAVNDWDRSRSFWWRRFRRLYPALIGYLVLILPAMWWLQRLPRLPGLSTFSDCLDYLWPSLFYVSNYYPRPMPYGHLWSLGCEMQFYLVAPFIYLAGGRTPVRRTLVFGTLLFVLLALGAIEPLVPKIVARLGRAYNPEWKYHFELAVWPMMAGFFCEYRREWFSGLPEKIVTSAYWISLLSCLASFVLMLFGAEMKFLVVAAGTLLLFPCLLAYLYGRPAAGRPGNVLRWLGERTYSIYLWQQPLTICSFLPSLLHPAGALFSIVLGAVSFRFLEYPFLSVNRQRQKSAG